MVAVVVVVAAASFSILVMNQPGGMRLAEVGSEYHDRKEYATTPYVASLGILTTRQTYLN